MVSQHCVEQTIYGAKTRFRPTTTVGELRVSYHSENIPSYEVKDNDICRPAVRTVPPQTGSLAQRAIEEWERNLCENKAVAILEQMQAGKPALIKRWRRLPSLDRPLAEAKALVEASDVKFDICGEMNPLVFPALEGINLVFTLMVAQP